MQMKQKTISLTILCFVFLMVNLSLMRVPTATAFAYTGISCDALGDNLMYYGEDDQYVRFEAWYEEDDISHAWFNYSYDSGSWTAIDLGIGPNENITSRHVWCTYQLINTDLVNNVTAYFKFNCSSGSSSIETEVITINVAPEAIPDDVDTVSASAISGARIQVGWTSPAQYETSNAPVKNFTIYRKLGTDTGSFSESHAMGTAVGPQTTSFIDSTSVDGETYRYAVKAVDYAGRSSPNFIADLSSVIADGVIPTIASYLINGTSAILGSVVTVPLGGLVVFSITPSESFNDGIRQGSVKLTFTLLSGEIGPFSRNMIDNTTGDNYYFTFYTIPLGGEALKLGEYSITVGLTDLAGNTFSHTYEGQLKIVPPPDPTLMIVLIVLGIAAVGAAGGFVGVKKLKLRQQAAKEGRAAETKSKRKGAIFKGASSLGRASGDEAEAILAQRGKQKATSSSSGPVSSTKPQSAAELRTKPSSEELKPKEFEKFETLDSRASIKDVKLAEKQTVVDMGKKADFLDARISSQEKVMGVVVSLVEMLPETSSCEKCGKPLVPGWAQCPWCLVESHSDELELKLSIAGIDMKKANACPKCRAALNPIWTKCPYCAVKDVKS